MAILTGLLIPILLAAGLAASSLRGGIDMGDPAFEVTRVDQAHFSDLPGEPVFVLLVGHDARPGDRTARGDALHLVGVNPAAGRATILNFPRDLWVPIPGRGTAKINAGYEFGGAALQARTVAQLVGVNIPYVITTGFEGFQAMVDDLGGMEVDVPMAMADRNSGAFFSPGVTHMDGWQALAMARNRGLAGGDITRTTNQAHLILAALTKLRGESPTVAKTLHWLAVLLRNATLDGAGYADLYRLGRLALSIDPANVRSYTVPGTIGSAANQSVVFLGGGASALFADFRDDAVLQSH